MDNGRILISVILAAILSIVLTPTSTEATTPIYKEAGEDISSFDRPKVVPDPELTYAYYAELAPGGTDVYQVWPKAGQPADIALVIPRLEDLVDFKPSLSLAGPGIGPPPTGTSNSSPLAQAVVLDYPGDTGMRPAEIEPRTQARYWKGQRYQGAFPQAGPYYVIVSEKQPGRGGKYVLVLGSKDDTGLGEMVKAPFRWVKLQLWYGNWFALLIVGLLLLVALYGAARLMGRMRHKSQEV